MILADISGAYDLHVHASPELFPRLGDDLDMARHAAEVGLAGLLIKNHCESTVGRARLAQKIIDGTKVFGGLVLNHFTGGINPAAVEASLALGAKQIWMPTIDAAAHGAVFGHLGGFGYQESGLKLHRLGLSVLDDSGWLSEATKAIVELVRDAGAILGTAHLGREEIFALAAFAGEMKLDKLLITHPEFNPPRLSLEDLKALIHQGAWVELCGGNLYPIPGQGRIDDYRGLVAELGARRIVLSSDAGQPRKSLPGEVLRIFAQCLLDKGVSQAEIDIMTKENPARLLSV